MLSIDDIFLKLENVIDPELGVNVVDLGLVYDVIIEKGDVNITMTLTSPYCPLQEQIEREAIEHVKTLNEVNNVTVDFVWTPPWNPEMMNEVARLELG